MHGRSTAKSGQLAVQVMSRCPVSTTRTASCAEAMLTSLHAFSLQSSSKQKDELFRRTRPQEIKADCSEDFVLGVL